MLIIAHRGAWFNGEKIKDIIYQNTLNAFRDADELDLDAVETDIRKCSCGALLLSHDSFTGCACTQLTPLQAILKFGEWMNLHLEIKERGIVKDILRQTMPLRHEQAIIYSSFHWMELWRIKRSHKRARIGMLFGENEKNIPKFAVFLAARVVGAESIHLDIEVIKKNPAIVMYFRKKGLEVYSYTVNEIDEIMLARKLNLDAIFTDYPTMAMEYLSMNIH